MTYGHRILWYRYYTPILSVFLFFKILYEIQDTHIHFQHTHTWAFSFELTRYLCCHSLLTDIECRRLGVSDMIAIDQLWIIYSANFLLTRSQITRTLATIKWEWTQNQSTSAMNSAFGESFMFLTKLAWNCKVTLPILVTAVFLALDFRMQIELNIETEQIVFQVSEVVASATLDIYIYVRFMRFILTGRHWWLGWCRKCWRWNRGWKWRWRWRLWVRRRKWQCTESFKWQRRFDKRIFYLKFKLKWQRGRSWKSITEPFFNILNLWRHLLMKTESSVNTKLCFDFLLLN